MKFGVGSDFDVEVVAGFGADEFDQFVGVAEFAEFAHPGWQIAAQGDEAMDALGAVMVQNFPSARASRSHASQVRGGVHAAVGLNRLNRLERAVAGGATRAIGDREKRRPHPHQFLAGGEQLAHPLVGVGGEEFTTENPGVAFLGIHDDCGAYNNPSPVSGRGVGVRVIFQSGCGLPRGWTKTPLSSDSSPACTARPGQRRCRPPVPGSAGSASPRSGRDAAGRPSRPDAWAARRPCFRTARPG